MKKLVKGIAGVLSAGILSLLAVTLTAQARLPDKPDISTSGEIHLSQNLSAVIKNASTSLKPVLYAKNGEIYSLNINWGGKTQAQPVQAQVQERKMVIPGGTPFGIKMFTEGVMVVGMTDIQVGPNNVNPAKNAGIKVGDILLSINDFQLSRSEDVAKCVSDSEGGEIRINLMRGGAYMEAYLSPVKTEYDNKYRAGIWVRDSSAGIGTLTYYNPATMEFAGLGHAVCDIDTGKLMPLSSGEICDVNISGVNPGQSGKPGELRGTFSGGGSIGTLRLNTDLGVFGSLTRTPDISNEIPMAFKNEVATGPAYILSTVSGNKPRQFSIEIEKINYMDTSSTKNMVIKVTDPALIAVSGGIVQGMSGSPIIQNGRLVGAVTHVFVNDPTRGYAIFAENMDERGNK